MRAEATRDPGRVPRRRLGVSHRAVPPVRLVAGDHVRPSRPPRARARRALGGDRAEPPTLFRKAYASGMLLVRDVEPYLRASWYLTAERLSVEIVLEVVDESTRVRGSRSRARGAPRHGGARGRSRSRRSRAFMPSARPPPRSEARRPAATLGSKRDLRALRRTADRAVVPWSSVGTAGRQREISLDSSPLDPLPLHRRAGVSGPPGQVRLRHRRRRLVARQGHHRRLARRHAQGARPQGRRPEVRPLHQRRPWHDEPLPARRGVRDRGRRRDRPRHRPLRALPRPEPERDREPHRRARSGTRSSARSAAASTSARPCR